MANIIFCLCCLYVKSVVLPQHSSAVCMSNQWSYHSIVQYMLSISQQKIRVGRNIEWLLFSEAKSIIKISTNQMLAKIKKAAYINHQWNYKQMKCCRTTLLKIVNCKQILVMMSIMEEQKCKQCLIWAKEIEKKKKKKLASATVFFQQTTGHMIEVQSSKQGPVVQN